MATFLLIAGFSIQPAKAKTCKSGKDGAGESSGVNISNNATRIVMKLVETTTQRISQDTAGYVFSDKYSYSVSASLFVSNLAEGLFFKLKHRSRS